ncbi:MAG: RIP metalloprotease RseP [Ignavibacteriae bacterium]|nr:RIP metalloprotease RseP [Ignavibacteriota bacterium]MCB9207037.1 RIP metalloprotease RseP [Ignavibacteriales bacterium]MCB9207786.1 RIP metalloprotease RseP [Ignavibacteriales bacterium]MCB9258556.1 RIP metalloprotease RseP [Ignavibacteriales bacterium]
MFDSVIYFIITIGILVFVHELGHFLAARICKMRTDAFALGFGQRLFGYNQINGFTFGSLEKDFDLQGHTDYKVCLLPLGGYVKISGMVDESFDTKFASQEPKPYEFRAKPTYQKLFVITAGVMMNLTLAILIFWGVNYYQPKTIMQTTKIGHVADSTLAYKAGFRSYDKIISVNGYEVNDWESLLNTLLIKNMGKDVDVKVVRNNEETNFIASKDILSKAAQETSFFPIGDISPTINDVLDESPAASAGLDSGDVFLKINDKNVYTTAEVIDIISNSKDTDLNITILREKDTVNAVVNPGSEGKIGIYISDVYGGEIDFEEYGLGESLMKSVTNIGGYTALTFKMLGSVIKGDVAFESSFGGPVKIAKFASQSADQGIIPFLLFLAMLSLSLAIINIMPFPVLDGGHFVIILIEGIIRRELPIKLKLAIQNFGFVILLMLMAYIIYTDIATL